MSSNLRQLYKEIQKKLDSNSPSKHFAVFDFDNTCIYNDISEAVLAYMAERNLFRNYNFFYGKNYDVKADYSRAIFEHYYALIEDGNLREAYKFCAETLSGLSVVQVNDIVEKTLASEGSKLTMRELYGRKIAKGINIQDSVFDLMNYLRTRHVRIWIISASPSLIVAATIKHFGMVAKLIGIDNVLKRGVVQTELKQPLPIFEGKVNCIKKFINTSERPLLGAGDSMNDLAMLEYCDIKLVVDRQKALAAKARLENWFLI